MFERFSDRARRVVVLAQDEARDLGHHYIGTEHLLLGLLHDSAGTAWQVLARLQVTPEAVREKVGEQVSLGEEKPQGHVPFSPPAKKSLELALREALRLGHNYIGSGHLLLGLIREERGTAAKVLDALDVSLDRARALVGDTAAHTEVTPGPRAFGINPYGELTGRLKGIEERLTEIETRLSGIEERLA